MPAFMVMRPVVAVVWAHDVVCMPAMVTMPTAMMVVMQMMAAAQPKSDQQRN